MRILLQVGISVGLLFSLLPLAEQRQAKDKAGRLGYVVLSAIPATTETMSDRGNNNSQSNNAALLEEELTEFCRSDSLSEGGRLSLWSA